MVEHGAQIIEIEQQQTLLVGDVEDDVQHAFLRIVQFQQTCQQQRPHLRNRRADRMALLAEQVPENDRRRLRLQVDPHAPGALEELVVGRAGHGHARQVALDVGGEDRNAGVGKGLGHDLQSHGLAGPRRTCHQTVTIGAIEQKDLRGRRLPHQNARVHHSPSP